ncbi:hypothetical protein [Xanthomonas arboricola]|uniref:hypothetical protein n=1 Tax=Xanthomonas arboricola TaxID=56448 RepID=UPI0011B06096|nr:hypothetical protein [Xanthomonas arboricola]
MNKIARSLLKSSALVLMLGACATSITRPSVDRYILSVTDDVEERRFEVVLKSLDDRSLCVSKDSWPNIEGRFTVEMEGVYVKSGGEVFFSQSNLMSAYCPGGCGEHRIKPKSELRGRVSYESFSDSRKFENDTSKQLVLSVNPYYCR